MNECPGEGSRARIEQITYDDNKTAGAVASCMVFVPMP